MTEKKEPKKFEDAMAELEQVVRKLEVGDASLEKSLELFERGVALAGFCHHSLEDAQKRIEIATKNSDGSLVLTPFGSPASEEEGGEEEDDTPPKPGRRRA